MIHLTMKSPRTFRIEAGPLDVSRLRTVPGVHAWPQSKPPHWSCPATIYHGVVLRNVFGEDMTYDDDVRQVFLRLRAGEKRRMERKNPGFEKLYDFQGVGVNRLVVAPGVILGDEVGTGKTVQALTALGVTEGLPALVVTTRTMKLQWVDEMRKWGPFKGVPYPIVGDAGTRKKQLAAALADPQAVVIMNWDQLRHHSSLAHYPGTVSTPKEQALKELDAFTFRTVILDEAHRMAEPDSKWTRAAWKLAHRAEWVWELTGTPTNGDYVNIWSLLHAIVPEEASARSKWLDRYVVSIPGFKGRPEPLFLRPENKDELFWWLDQYMLRRKIAEIPELRDAIPQVIDVKLTLELTKEQKSAYKAMKKEYMARFGDSILIETDPMIRAGRLRYIASAMPVVDELGEVIGIEGPSNKLDAVKELLSDPEKRPMVIFSESSKIADFIQHELSTCDKKYRVEKITGDVSEGQRHAYKTQFQNDELDALVLTSAGGEGITLTNGACMVFFQTPHSLIHYTQMKGRVPRIGSVRKLVMAYHLVSEGTNDESVHEAQVEKKYRFEDINGDLRRIYGSL